MKRSSIEILVTFLLANAILAVYVLIKISIKDKVEDKPQASAVTAPTHVIPTTIVKDPANDNKNLFVVPNAIQTPPITKQPLDNKQILETNIAKAIAPIPATPIPSCVVMGPFNFAEKSTVDFILNKNEQSSLAKVDRMTTHQIYWNLGKDKTNADTLFKKQKEGPMADAKFVLTQNGNKDWVVNIAKVIGTEATAEKLTKELEEKAKKVNAGGGWESVVLSHEWFYKFESYKNLKMATINSLDVTLTPKKKPC